LSLTKFILQRLQKKIVI